MNSGKRIILNTAAQYVRAIITTCLSLYSVRLILDALGVSDYGIYTVIAGVIALLGFITNSLVITTQRYISFHYGQTGNRIIRQLFVNSLLLHIIIAALLFIIFMCLKDFAVYEYLNIPNERRTIAESVYFISSLLLVITILTAPFKALFIARENIVFISIVEIIDGFVKLAVAISLAYISYDKLMVYALMIAAIQTGNLLVFAGYALLRFPECTIKVRIQDINKSYLREIAGFAGWTTYGMGAIACRTQGLAVILNQFFGTIINAAYGIANQVFAAMAFIASSLLNAMNPQIMKAEGASNRSHMLKLACQQSKFSTAMLMITAIPVMSEIHALLSLWLKEVPPHTEMFCQFILIAFICDQLTIGLNAANQAMGQIRTYTLLMFTPKLLYLPLAYFILQWGGTPEQVMWLYVAIEIVVALMRIPYLHHSAGLRIGYYFNQVILPLLPLCIVSTIVSYVCSSINDHGFRFLITLTIAGAAGLATAWAFTLSEEEKLFFKGIVLHRKEHAND
jgi:O-antigen/teichoic acid export membrane protein